MEETNEMSFTDLGGRDVPCASIFTKFSALILSWLLLIIHLVLSFLSRIFRKKKRIRRSFSSLFNLSASESWLHGSTFGNADSSPTEDVWLEGVRRLETNHCNENGESEPLFPGEISKREVATMWSWTNGEESMGATQWRPGVLRALQDVFREGEEGDQVPYIHALDSDHTDLRCFLSTVLFLSSAASLLWFICWDSFIHSFVHLEDFIEGQLGIRHRSTHWDVSVNKTDKTICSHATCIPDEECNDVNYEACWKVVRSVGQQRRKRWAFQVSVGWLAWPSWKWLLSTDLNVGVKHLGRNNRAKEMQGQRFWPRSLRGAEWVRGEGRSGSQRCMGGAAAEGQWDLWDHFKGFALCSEWGEKRLEDFEQKNNVVHLTFWQHSSGCCVQVGGEVGIEGRSKETSEEVLEWLGWERMAAWTKMIAGWRWEWEGFWIHFDGRANRILLTWAERRKESSQGCLLYA